MLSSFLFDVWHGNTEKCMFPVMSNKRATGTLPAAERLRLSRLALKLTQARLCAITGISTQAWNNAETGDARIGIDNAILLCDATGLTLDWIYRGIKGGLPTAIGEAIAKLEAEPVARKRA